MLHMKNRIIVITLCTTLLFTGLVLWTFQLFTDLYGEAPSISNFEIVYGVVEDASEHSIIMTADISADTLTITIYNDSDDEFIFTSGSYLNNNYSPIQYFDGENWRVVPIRSGVNLTEYDSAYVLEPEDSTWISLSLRDYQMPESGQFRFQLRGSLSTEFTFP